MADQKRGARLLAEAVVIVVSILLAFWIDASWESRQARAAERRLLESIRTETAANRVNLDVTIATNRGDLERFSRFLAASPDELQRLPQDSVALWLGSIVIAWTYDGDHSATGLLLDSFTPVTAQGRRVRNLAARWVRVLEDAGEEKATLWDLGTRLTARLAPLAVPAAEAGQGFVHQIAARRGPSVLADLRRDSDFVAAALDKTHYQNIYLIELDQASGVLDSLQSAIR
ncbi:MAG: hypothetical protein HKN72_02455 [Gemmatimonadetes bacterium]|nr:hypothetical protein [Gemmatimonadota bacterium]